MVWEAATQVKNEQDIFFVIFCAQAGPALSGGKPLLAPIVRLTLTPLELAAKHFEECAAGM
jgi:hypothetical protein